MRASRALALLVLLTVSSLGAASAVGEVASSYREAVKIAAAQDRLLVVDFYAVWCGPCKAFDRARQTDDALQAALDRVVFVSIDAEKGEGIELARKHSVHGYPTFVVMNDDEETIDRWTGYGDVAGWVANLDRAVADPTTLRAKQARFRALPTRKDAETLAEVSASLGRYDDAVGYYTELQRLDAAQGARYRLAAFEASTEGLRAGVFTPQQVEAQAQNILGQADVAPRELLLVAMGMRTVAQHLKRPEVMVPYLRRAVEATEGSAEGIIRKQRAYLLVDHALYVEKDKEKAFEHRRALLPEGWENSPDHLNEFAWWCFQQNVNLEEAERLARHGVELATEPKDKANVLDTVAEICNARGDCRDAVTLIEQALALDPGSEYLQRQHERFQKILASAD